MRITKREILKIESNEIKVNNRELALRLQMNFDAEISVADDALKLVREAADCRACYIKCDLCMTDEKCDFGLGGIESKSLRKNLDGCRSVYVVALTTGIGIDRLIAREAVRSSYRQFLVDAAASAFADGFADFISEKLAGISPVRPRFSPGFGGFELVYQKKIIDLLDAGKLIGLSVTDNNIMIPKKSITAVVGTDWG